jgi:hypothetical protein
MRRSLTILAAAILTATQLATIPVDAASSFAVPQFEAQWRTGEAAKPNFWGPLATARDGQQEQYKEALGGQRTIQYFDKARMELASNGGVTTGLLTVELKTGRTQMGDAVFEQRQPAKVNIAGDPSSDGPTYADLQQLPEMRPKPAGGVGIAPYVYRNGRFDGPSMNDTPVNLATPPGTPFVTYIGDPGGRYGDFVYQPFLDFINALPLPLSQTTGYPISPFFAAQVKIAGTPTWVLVQPFERRVLTYNPNNPPATRVEFGNIGQHYYAWRYGAAAAAAPVPTPVAISPSPSTPAKPAADDVTVTDTTGSIRVILFPMWSRAPAFEVGKVTLALAGPASTGLLFTVLPVAGDLNVSIVATRDYIHDDIKTRKVGAITDVFIGGEAGKTFAFIADSSSGTQYGNAWVTSHAGKTLLIISSSPSSNPPFLDIMVTTLQFLT